MGYGKRIALLLTLLFLVAAVLIGSLDTVPEKEEETLPISICVRAGESQEELLCWKQEEGNWYFFLPSYGEMDTVTFQLVKGWEVQLDQQRLDDGMSCEDFQTAVPYRLTARKDGTVICAAVTILRSENIPAMYIDVRSGNMEYIHSEKGNEEPGSLRIYTPEGSLDYAGSIASINGRGNYSWNPDKKPYSITLQQEGNLMGMGAAQRWILIANYSDPSHLRNKLVFDFAEKAGLKYAPDSTWVDLYLNGEYAGLYLLCERNEIHPQRVDIGEDGVLVSMELQYRLERQEYPHVVINSDTALRIHSGQKPTEEFAAVWKSLDNAIRESDGVDPQTGKHVSEMIDVESWVKKYLLEEIFGNLDAGTVSQYFYIDTNGETDKIQAGPVWDYDLTLGNDAVWQTVCPEAFYADKAYAWTDENPTWFYALCQKDFFQAEIKHQYETIFRPLVVQLMETELKSCNQGLASASELNRVRWSAGDMEEETAKMQSFLQRRMAFLDSLWLEGETYCTVIVDMGAEVSNACYAVRPGEQIPFLPDYEENGKNLGWYNAKTGEPFLEDAPIWEDTVIYLRTEETTETGISRFHLLPIAAITALTAGVLLADIRYIYRSKSKQSHEKVLS